jgi:hypothetical protein
VAGLSSGPPQRLQAPRDTHATPLVEVVTAELGKGVVYLAVLGRGDIASLGDGEHDSHETDLADIARVLIRLELANYLLDGNRLTLASMSAAIASNTACLCASVISSLLMS